ncbi:ribonuclease P [Thermosphaera chiliense]|uniref:Ribonuclease P protein component 4 n=1 Tax=Thermosphaera chiliense TaxID=3402707 RepID=A0A7M1URA2_9CREN|nr:ribonuclease P [Thermosphaera aggregans]QOR94790.1 ribonuclease P [Thermosphaera aggregans]
MPRSRVNVLREIARERIVLLYKLAVEQARKGDYALARRYVEIMLKISAKARVKPPRYIRRGYCRSCKIPLIPGVTSRVRVRSDGSVSRVVVSCLACGWMRRYVVKTSGRG